MNANTSIPVITRSDALTNAVAQARERYAAARPRTRELHERARNYLPGGGPVA